MAKHKVAVEEAKAANKPAPRAPQLARAPGTGSNEPSSLYNGMIEPLLPFAIKGAIWYQGESNAGKPIEYRTLFAAMIGDWRKKWGYEFPFFCVQLAPFNAGNPEGENWAFLREAQFLATKKLKSVGMAVITDAGDPTDIHPQAKEPVGARLALSARAIAYGEKIEHTGPLYKSMKVNGDSVAIEFDNVGGGLVAKHGDLKGFTIAGEDHKFVPAKAIIEGNTVVVIAESVKKPVAVRFAWKNYPVVNLFSKSGLPANPFRTDDLPFGK
jgi:sialate O-acetylesterase